MTSLAHFISSTSRSAGAAFAAAGLFLAGCGEGPEPVSEDHRGPGRVIACDLVQWSATAGQPFDRLAISGIPDAIDVPLVEVRTGPDFGYLSPLLPSDDQNAELPLPIYVDERGIGHGTAEISLVGEGARCPPVSVEIGPLAEAPADTLPRLVDSLEGVGDAYRGMLGLDRGQLVERG